MIQDIASAVNNVYGTNYLPVVSSLMLTVNNDELYLEVEILK